MTSRRAVAWSIAVLEVVMAVGAVAGAWFVLGHRNGTEGMPLSWLDGSPFSDYLVPGLTLLVAIGLVYFAGAYVVLSGRTYAGWITAALGVELIGWIVAEVAIIGWVSVLQPIVLAWAIVVLALGLGLARADAAPATGIARPPRGAAHGTSAR